VQDSIDALRQIPHVLSVELIDEGAVDSSVDVALIQRLLSSKKKLSLVGKEGCAVFFYYKSSIVLIKSKPNVNLGALDLVLDSIK
jgi:hypothetical protein